MQATRLPLQAIGRVKGSASRGEGSNASNEHEHEHEDEGPNVYNCVSLSERQAGALALQRDFRSSILSYSILFAPCSMLAYAPYALCSMLYALCSMPYAFSRPGDEAELVVLL